MTKESESTGSSSISLTETLRRRHDIPWKIKLITVDLYTDPGNLDALIKNFDRGDTLLGDATGLTLNKRNLILKFGPEHLSLLPPQIKKVYEKTVYNLGNCMSDHAVYRKAAGWLLLSDALRYQKESEHATRGLNECLLEEHGLNIQNFVDNYRDRPDEVGKFITDIAGNPKYTSRLAYYLACRTQIYERQQLQKYGGLLRESKDQIGTKLRQMAIETGLPDAYLNRTLAQLDRTCFSASDPIIERQHDKPGLLIGKYSDEQLRLELKYNDKSDSDTGLSEKTIRIALIHELIHSASAQFSARRGLKIANEQGIEADESMTEYLAQLTGNFLDIHKQYSLLGNSFYIFESSYPIGTAAMYDLHLRHPKDFAALFNAYFGYAQPNLLDALNQYYSILNERKSRFWKKSRNKVYK